MDRRLLLICLAVAVLHFPASLFAQFTDARSYDNAPVGVNQLEFVYSYARSDASIDPSLIIAGAKLSLNAGRIDYTRYFGLLHRMAWAEASLPIGGLTGSVVGTNIHGSANGAGDSSYQLAVLLKGGPALSVAQFANYKPVTTVGVSLTVTAPTGLYNAQKVLNLGADRWSFKPEIAVSAPFGPSQKWELDAYANAYFFTDNTSYREKEILRQQPLPGLEGHLSYSFTDNFWASVNTRYSFRGDTFVNGVDQSNGQQNFTLGCEANLSLNSRNSLFFEVARALVHKNGPAYTGLALKYSYSWGKGYR
jgi:hypothetical protein